MMFSALSREEIIRKYQELEKENEKVNYPPLKRRASYA